jgi:hypothetical protein
MAYLNGVRNAFLPWMFLGPSDRVARICFNSRTDSLLSTMKLLSGITWWAVGLIGFAAANPRISAELLPAPSDGTAANYSTQYFDQKVRNG